jgi:hypothetical protein
MHSGTPGAARQKRVRGGWGLRPGAFRTPVFIGQVAPSYDATAPIGKSIRGGKIRLDKQGSKNNF